MEKEVDENDKVCTNHCGSSMIEFSLLSSPLLSSPLLTSPPPPPEKDKKLV